MPGTNSPQHGVQAFWVVFGELKARVHTLEMWQRQTRGMPSGTITRWGGAIPPPGALLCDGSTFSALTYPALYAVLGSTSLPGISGSPIWVIWT